MTPFENGVGIQRDPGNFGSDGRGGQVAFEEGANRLAAAVGAAARGEPAWAGRVSAGLRAGLELLAGDSDLARLLAVGGLAAPIHPAYQRGLERLAKALRRPAAELPLGAGMSHEAARLLAGGLASRVAGRVVAGGTARLPELHDELLTYILTVSRSAEERRAANG